jgi:hypothetical protein
MTGEREKRNNPWMPAKIRGEGTAMGRDLMGSGKGFVAAVGVAAIAIPLVYAVSRVVPRKVRGEVVAERITLTDRLGNPRLLAEVGRDNAVRLTLCDAAGVHRAVLSVTAGGKTGLRLDEQDAR